MTSVPPTQPTATPETDVRLTEAERDAAMENRVMEALRQCLLGDRAIPPQHERWWRNLAREAIEAARAGIIVEREAGK